MKDEAHHMKGVQRKVIQTHNKLNGTAISQDKNTSIHETTLMPQKKLLENPRASVSQKRLPIY